MNVFFGEEFDSRNSLSIKGEKNSSKKEIEIELIFDTKPPIKVISAINSCDVIEEKYISDEHQQYNAEESFKKSTPSNQESKKINLKITKGSKKTQNKKEDNSLVAALSLDRIAKYSSSFEDFVKNVAMYFELDKRSETFQKWVICASNAEIISWKVIDEELSKFGKVRYNTSNDRHACSKK